MLQSEEQEKLNIFSDLGISEIFSSLKMLQRRLTNYADMGSQLKKMVFPKASDIQQRWLDNLIIQNGNF